MSDEEAESNSVSPVLKADWFNSRWGREDQRGNGNLMTREKVLEATQLIKTGEIVSLGMPYDARMPIAPGRAYALRMPGGPTGGPYGDKSKTIWNDEFIATEIGQIGTQMDALGHLGCMCGMRGDKTKMLFYNGNRLSEMWSPYGLKKLGMENARPFFTRGFLFDVQGLKGRVLDVGEEIALADLKACLERQGVEEQTISPGDAVFVRTGHGSRWYTETRTFYDGAPGIGLECARWFSSLEVCVVGADNFAVEVVPPVDPEIFHPCHQHLIMENGIHLHEGMTFEGLVERQAWVFAYVFAPAADRRRHWLTGESDRGVVGRSRSVWLIVAIMFAVKNLPGRRAIRIWLGTRPNILYVRFTSVSLKNPEPRRRGIRQGSRPEHSVRRRRERCDPESRAGGDRRHESRQAGLRRRREGQ